MTKTIPVYVGDIRVGITPELGLMISVGSPEREPLAITAVRHDVGDYGSTIIELGNRVSHDFVLEEHYADRKFYLKGC